MAARWSLQRRLIAGLALAALAAWAVSAAWLVHVAATEARRAADAALVETGHLVLALAGATPEADRRRRRGDGERRRDAANGHDVHDDDTELPRIGPLEHAHAERLFYQLRDRAGSVALRSPGAPAAPLAPAASRGLSDQSLDGAGWRVFTLHDDASGLTLHIGEPAAQRAAFARDAWLRLTAPGLALIAALVLATVWVTRRTLRPVAQAARALDAAAPGAPTPLAVADLPAEIAPLAQAIERLQARVEQALLHERTLTADAAHELRTPLAALHAQAQWAARAPDEPSRRQALDGVIAAAQRCARLVDAVLTLARLDARTLDRRQLPPQPLAALAQWVIDEHAAAAARRGISVGAELAAIDARVDADAVAVALRNLLDNALRHARAQLRVAVQPADGGAAISVTDDGPGLAADECAQIFERFYRPPGAGGDGSGLGLALVRRVAELHGGRAFARRREGGFEVGFTLPGGASSARM